MKEYICNMASSHLCAGRGKCPYAYRHTHPLPKHATCTSGDGTEFRARSVPYKRKKENDNGTAR